MQSEGGRKELQRDKKDKARLTVRARLVLRRLNQHADAFIWLERFPTGMKTCNLCVGNCNSNTRSQPLNWHQLATGWLSFTPLNAAKWTCCAVMYLCVTLH